MGLRKRALIHHVEARFVAVEKSEFRGCGELPEPGRNPGHVVAGRVGPNVAIKWRQAGLAKSVLSGLGLLQLLPPLLQGCGDPPPLFQFLLEGAVSGAVLPHHRQFFLLDISQLRTTVLAAGISVLEILRAPVKSSR